MFRVFAHTNVGVWQTSNQRKRRTKGGDDDVSLYISTAVKYTVDDRTSTPCTPNHPLPNVTHSCSGKDKDVDAHDTHSGLTHSHTLTHSHNTHTHTHAVTSYGASCCGHFVHPEREFRIRSLCSSSFSTTQDQRNKDNGGY